METEGDQRGEWEDEKTKMELRRLDKLLTLIRHDVVKTKKNEYKQTTFT